MLPKVGFNPRDAPKQNPQVDRFLLKTLAKRACERLFLTDIVPRMLNSVFKDHRLRSHFTVIDFQVLKIGLLWQTTVSVILGWQRFKIKYRLKIGNPCSTESGLKFLDFAFEFLDYFFRF